MYVLHCFLTQEDLDAMIYPGETKVNLRREPQSCLGVQYFNSKLGCFPAVQIVRGKDAKTPKIENSTQVFVLFISSLRVG